MTDKPESNLPCGVPICFDKQDGHTHAKPEPKGRTGYAIADDHGDCLMCRAGIESGDGHNVGCPILEAEKRGSDAMREKAAKEVEGGRKGGCRADATAYGPTCNHEGAEYGDVRRCLAAAIRGLT